MRIPGLGPQNLHFSTSSRRFCSRLVFENPRSGAEVSKLVCCQTASVLGFADDPGLAGAAQSHRYTMKAAVDRTEVNGYHRVPMQLGYKDGPQAWGSVRQALFSGAKSVSCCCETNHPDT